MAITIDPSLSILLGLIFGAIGGFLNSIVGWLSGEEAFNTRKNVKSIIVGILAGMGIAFGSFAALGEAQTPQALLGILVLILLSATGVQQLAHNAIKAATKGEPPVLPAGATTTAATVTPTTATATITTAKPEEPEETSDTN